MPAFELTVIADFGEYSRGSTVVDPTAVAAILASENSVRVVKVAPGTHTVPEPAAPPAPAVDAATAAAPSDPAAAPVA